MKITMGNIIVDLINPQRKFYRITNVMSGNFKDFLNKDEALKAYSSIMLDSYRLYEVIQDLDDFGKVITTRFKEVKG